MTSEENSVHRFAHQAMGTTFEGWVAGCETSYAGQAAQAVFSEVDRLEILFSRFNPSSEICQMNRLRPGQSMRIGFETYDCLTIAEKIRQETGGAFDVNFRMAQKMKTRAGEGNTPFLLSREGGFSIALAGENSGLDLDLGGIGKGYALDRAAEILAEWEIDRFLIHAGTSTALARGDAPNLKPGERGWPVGFGIGLGLSGHSERILLNNRALSGSGVERKGLHIIDPRSGHPAQRHLAVWVSHPRAAEADALSTAFMAMSMEEIAAFYRLHPEVWATIVESDQRKQKLFRGVIP